MGRAEAAPAVVVTGTSSGIGRVTALDLDRRGFRVFAGVRRDEDGRALRQAASGRLTPLRFDVTDALAIARSAREVAAVVGAGGLAGLVNNAGIGRGGPLEFADLEELRQLFEVNALGPAAVARAFLPLLRLARGRVVNVSSALGRQAMPLVGGYCASKSALEALSDALRVELRRSGIHVAVIQPGVVAAHGRERARVVGREALAKLPAEGRECYGAALARREAAAGRFEGRATPPEAVARAIHRALTARRPRARYPVGWDARGVALLERLLPDRVKDAIFGGMVGL